jgi:hypothetical protein
VFWFAVQSLSEKFLISWRIRRDIVHVNRSSFKVPFILVRFEWSSNFVIEFSRRIFEKSLNTKLHENPFSGGQIVPHEQTDGQTDMTWLIVDFRNFERASKTKTTTCNYSLYRWWWVWWRMNFYLSTLCADFGLKTEWTYIPSHVMWIWEDMKGSTNYFSKIVV